MNPNSKDLPEPFLTTVKSLYHKKAAIWHPGGTAGKLLRAMWWTSPEKKSSSSSTSTVTDKPTVTDFKNLEDSFSDSGYSHIDITESYDPDVFYPTRNRYSTIKHISHRSSSTGSTAWHTSNSIEVLPRLHLHSSLRSL